jgi:hypothetical protein
MQNEKNKLFKQTDSQRSPGLAKPEDFKINPPDTNKSYPFHGQTGDSKRECDALLKVREIGQPKHDKTNYESRIEKELAREHDGTKQPGE